MTGLVFIAAFILFFYLSLSNYFCFPKFNFAMTVNFNIFELQLIKTFYHGRVKYKIY